VCQIESHACESAHAGLLFSRANTKIFRILTKIEVRLNFFAKRSDDANSRTYLAATISVSSEVVPQFASPHDESREICRLE